ncbi:unnamed protein product [Adineta steineri]|uniref:Uncharacterized protein n=1 Tax=Adineta steineri TaxID=433720 RepID=A0A815L8R2_9BILA|nr:unnamed protein product [Adineta steineri]
MNVSFFTIVAILCLQTLSTCIISNIGQYIYSYYLQTYAFTSNDTLNLTNDTLLSSVDDFNISNKDPEQCSNSVSNEADAWAQQQSADLFSKIGLWRSGPMIIMTCILGLYMSRLGKRFVLILSMIGIAMQVLIWLTIIYFQLPEYWWYVAGFIVGLTGGEAVLHLVLNLFIIDCTKKNDRSTRFVLLEAMTTTLTAMTDFGIGYYIAWNGFADLLWASFILQLVSIFVVLLFFNYSSPATVVSPPNQTTSPLLSLTEGNNDVRIKESCCSTSSCRKFADVCTVFCRRGRSKIKSTNILLTLFAYIFYSLAYTAILSIFLWYQLDAPFCWSSTQIGNYDALASITCAIFSVLGMKLLTYVGANDAFICALSHVFFCGLSIWFAFARQSWQLYASLLISPFVDYQNSLTWSMMSKWLEPNEYTIVFTLITIIYTICSILGNSFFNWIYAFTVVALPKLMFFLAAGLCVIPFILNM